MLAQQQLFKLIKQDAFSKYAIDWHGLEKTLNSKLPDDYKNICDTLGAGSFGWVGSDENFLSFASPLMQGRSQAPIAIFPQNVFSVSKSFSDLAKEFPDLYTEKDFYPNNPGLINWGHDTNGNYYFWRTLGESNNWYCVIIKRNGDVIDIDGNMTETILRILKKELMVAEGLQSKGKNPVFKSYLE